MNTPLFDVKQPEENSPRWATLPACPYWDKLDWFDIALRQLGGVKKASKIIRIRASRLVHLCEHGWSSLSSSQMMDLARASGVPLLGLMMQCIREMGHGTRIACLDYHGAVTARRGREQAGEMKPKWNRQ
jgi:hypothetical protein